MFVILTQDVPQLGTKNSLIDVSDGYFSNYLGPKRLAQKANSSVIDSLKDELLERQKKRADSSQLSQEQLQSLTQVVLSLSSKASAKGTLFQAIAEGDIVSAIENQCGFSVNASSIKMEHIKKLGEHTIEVTLGNNTARVIVFVEEAKK